MPKLDDYDSLVSAIYEAALAPEQWPAVIARVTRSLDGATAIMFSPTAPPDQGGCWESPDYSAARMQAYAEYYHDKDMWQLAGCRLGSVPTVVTGEFLVPEPVFRRSEFYNDFLRQQDIFRVISATVAGANDRVTPEVRLSVFRPPGAAPFGTRAQRQFTVLAPHLRRALQMQRLLARKANEAAAYASALERLKVGVVLVDARLQVLYANTSAKAILDARDGITLRLGKLAGAAASVSGKIAKALHAAMSEAGDPRSTEIAIERPSGRNAISLTVYPVDGSEHFHQEFPRTAALIFVSDPDAKAHSSGEALMRRHGLTPAEARLAAAIAAGDTLRHASERFGVTVATARVQLKSVFGKMQVHRQAELVRMLLSSAKAEAALADPGVPAAEPEPVVERNSGRKTR